MKKIFLKFGTTARIREIGGNGYAFTAGDASFNTPPMGANPPTA